MSKFVITQLQQELIIYIRVHIKNTYIINSWLQIVSTHKNLYRRLLSFKCFLPNKVKNLTCWMSEVVSPVLTKELGGGWMGKRRNERLRGKPTQKSCLNYIHQQGMARHVPTCRFFQQVMHHFQLLQLCNSLLLLMSLIRNYVTDLLLQQGVLK